MPKKWKTNFKPSDNNMKLVVPVPKTLSKTVSAWSTLMEEVKIRVIPSSADLARGVLSVQ